MVSIYNSCNLQNTTDITIFQGHLSHLAEQPHQGQKRATGTDEQPHSIHSTACPIPSFQSKHTSKQKAHTIERIEWGQN